MATIPKTEAPWGEYVPMLGPMTVEQFEIIPGVEEWTYELHEGRLIAMPGPGEEHGIIQSEVTFIIKQFLKTHGLGTINGTCCYVLSRPGMPDEVLCPDLSYLAPDHRKSMSKRGSYIVGAPDLAIEIASPSDTHPGLAAKAKVYLDAGVRLVWVLWPETQSVEVWRSESLDAPIALLNSGDTLEGLDVIPGFTCTVGEFFGA